MERRSRSPVPKAAKGSQGKATPRAGQPAAPAGQPAATAASGAPLEELATFSKRRQQHWMRPSPERKASSGECVPSAQDDPRCGDPFEGLEDKRGPRHVERRVVPPQVPLRWVDPFAHLRPGYSESAASGAEQQPAAPAAPSSGQRRRQRSPSPIRQRRPLASPSALEQWRAEGDDEIRALWRFAFRDACVSIQPDGTRMCSD